MLLNHKGFKNNNWDCGAMLKSLIGRIIRRSPLRWYIPNKVTRMEVIQRAIDALGARKYLEIGVFDGECFCSIKVESKIGVDPIAPARAVAAESTKPGVRYFALTSDEFFQTTAPQALDGGVDVAFIDGLHTYAQSYRDCINCLKYLKPNGLILLHDCLPTSEVEARVAKSVDEAVELNAGTSWDGAWVGDVWKAILKLRAQHSELQTFVLNCDHGIGVVCRSQNRAGLSLTLEQIDAMSYRDLAKDATRLLDLRNPNYLDGCLTNLGAARWPR